MTITQLESGVFGISDFGIAEFGRDLPYDITLSIPNGYLINTKITGKIIIDKVNGYLINTKIIGDIIR